LSLWNWTSLAMTVFGQDCKVWTNQSRNNEHRRKKHDNPRSNRGRGFLGKWSVPTSELLTISTVLVANMGKQSMTLTTPIMCKTTRENKTVEARILLDTGAGGLFMNSTYAKKHNFLLYPLKQPITPWNVDGTPNSQGKNHTLHLDPTSHRIHLATWMTPCHRNRNPRYHLWTPLVPKVPANCQLDKWENHHR